MGGGAKSSSASGFQGFWGTSFLRGAKILVENKKFAFTLAEVLITLGIIGVVAAMTLPALVQNYKEKATVTRLKKVYSVMSSAYLQAKNEYGTMDEWGLSDSFSPSAAASQDRVIDILSKYLKTASKCYYSDTTCKTWNASNLEGQVDPYDIYGNRIVLADGTVIGHIFINSENCDNNWGSGFLQNSCGSFKVDLNGNKAPNIYGKDIFQFFFTKEAILASGIANDTSITCFEDHRLHGIGCTGWVIYNENMDYLHCPDELSWNGKHKCK